MLTTLYTDQQIVVCVKPAGICSVDEPGGMPGLLREQLGGQIYTVHRLDQVTSGVMVFARDRDSASKLSACIRAGQYGKHYLAVLHGAPGTPTGTLRDLLYRDRAKRRTLVVDTPQKGAQEAILHYELLSMSPEPTLSLVRITPETGRTHQIRVQFASRGMPIVGERKYAISPDAQEQAADLALWSESLSFSHPATGQSLSFTAPPPQRWPWPLVYFNY